MSVQELQEMFYDLAVLVEDQVAITSVIDHSSCTQSFPPANIMCICTYVTHTTHIDTRPHKMQCIQHALSATHTYTLIHTHTHTHSLSHKGEMIDRIEHNVKIASVYVEAGRKESRQAVIFHDKNKVSNS